VKKNIYTSACIPIKNFMPFQPFLVFNYEYVFKVFSFSMIGLFIVSLLGLILSLSNLNI